MERGNDRRITGYFFPTCVVRLYVLKPLLLLGFYRKIYNDTVRIYKDRSICLKRENFKDRWQN